MHLERYGRLVIPIGTYEVNDRQTKGKLKRRNTKTLGTVFTANYDDGERGLTLKIDVDMLNPSVVAMLYHNGIIQPGDTTVFCNVYKDDKDKEGGRSAGGLAGPPLSAEGVDDVMPF